MRKYQRAIAHNLMQLDGMARRRVYSLPLPQAAAASRHRGSRLEREAQQLRPPRPNGKQVSSK